MKIIQTASKSGRQAMHKTLADQFVEVKHDQRGFAITARDAKGRRFHVCLTDADMERVLASREPLTIWGRFVKGFAKYWT